MAAAVRPALALGLLAATLPAAAATRYLAAPSLAPQVIEGVALKGKPLAIYQLTPALAVELQGTLDSATALKAAVTGSAPFVPGRVLFGGDDRPGLFCDLMRNRGLGSSTACLLDTDMDGRFDQAVRYDFNSARSDMVFITDKGKVRGGKLKATIPLGVPLAYRAVTGAAMPSAEVRLLWEAHDRKDSAGTVRTQVDLVVTDGSNFTGTEILSQQYVRATLAPQPIEIPFYGLKLTLRGLTAQRSLVYTAERTAEAVPIDFVFRGYVTRIIGY